jgi:hypothetical protein
VAENSRGEEDKLCSATAVVATAFTIGTDGLTDARRGSRTAENLEDEEARDPGRSGDGICGACGSDSGWCAFKSTCCVDGEDEAGGGGGELAGGEASRDGGIVSNCSGGA